MYVYILTNRKNGTLYIGVTSDIARRVWEHREGIIPGFSKRYGLTKIVHMEQFQDPLSAIQREKTLKKWRRQWKVELIEKGNPDWRDLWDELMK